MAGRSLTPWLLVAPALAFLGVAFLYPVITLLLSSVRAQDALSLGNYAAFFSDRFNLEVLGRTLRVALVVTFISALICYPAAYGMQSVPPRYRGLVTALIIVPLMTSPVARTYAWLVLLGQTGIVNSTLIGAGLVKEPVRILYTEWAVYIGLAQLFIPLMLLTLISAMENLPRDVVPAARSLGATSLQSFTRVILPLTREGLVVGGTLVFTGCITAYVTPALLGGARVQLLATLLYQKAGVTVDYAAASVISVIMLALTLTVAGALRGRTGRTR
ncbi:MAG: Spermidine Putrescine transporter permease component PotB [Deinococcus sp.]|nr:Spermidine Putrescine transporter permease component PotB [Deinococcus sp.]